MKKLFITAAAALALSGPAAAQSLQHGWFVIVGSYLLRHNLEATDNASRVMRAAERCGFKPAMGSSGQFPGMRGGRDVQFLGGYATKERARAVLFAVRPCVADAFIKRSVLMPEDED